MHRKGLQTLLSSYQAPTVVEASILNRFQQFVAKNALCFERCLEEGHVTGSAWIVDKDRSHVLLTHHRKLDAWFQLGGHADGDPDIFAVALKEAQEESGLRHFEPISTQIFDLDIHLVPDKKQGHYHYDVRFILEADRAEPLIVSHESKALAWVEVAKIRDFVREPSVLRMAVKTHPRIDTF